MYKKKSYLFESLAILIMASGFFLFFKGNLPNKLFDESPVLSNNIVVDSLMLEAIGDTYVVTSDSTSVKEVDVKEPVVLSESHVAVEENEGLDVFYTMLFNLETKKDARVRIAYFGDSMTDGDLIVQDLRKNYQNKYGGEGVGYVSITSESAQSRSTVIHKYSNNFKTESFLKIKKPQKPFGVAGQVWFANDTLNKPWVSYKAGRMKNLTLLNNPVLYYGNSENRSGKVEVVINHDTIVKTLDGTKRLNSLKLSSLDVNEMKLFFQGADSIPIYGVDFASNTGIYVDNFSNRGNSGLPLSLFDAGLMQRYQGELDYNLIILHYGANVLNYGSLDYNWYTNRMTNVVKHLKQCFPNSSILIISTADKSSKIDGVMITDPAVEPLVKAQLKYAQNTQVGFYNLYEKMGGRGSMVQWVEGIPNKANKDYTHLNHRGASEVSDMLFKWLEKNYHVFKNKKTESTPVVIDSVSVVKQFKEN